MMSFIFLKLFLISAHQVDPKTLKILSKTNLIFFINTDSTVFSNMPFSLQAERAISYSGMEGSWKWVGLEGGVGFASDSVLIDPSSVKTIMALQ